MPIGCVCDAGSVDEGSEVFARAARKWTEFASAAAAIKGVAAGGRARLVVERRWRYWVPVRGAGVIV